MTGLENRPLLVVPQTKAKQDTPLYSVIQIATSYTPRNRQLSIEQATTATSSGNCCPTFVAVTFDTIASRSLSYAVVWRDCLDTATSHTLKSPASEKNRVLVTEVCSYARLVRGVIVFATLNDASPQSSDGHSDIGHQGPSDA